MPQRPLAILWQHAQWLGIVLIDPRRGWLSKLSVLGGLGYLFVPWDIIPDRTPYIGHLDEATFVIGGFVIGGLLAPHSIGHSVTADIPPLAISDKNRALMKHRMQAALVGWWMVFRRRPRRIAKRAAAVVQGRQRRPSLRVANSSPLHNLVTYRRHWQIHAPFVRTKSRSADLIVIGGAARSGTTLLRSILGRHPLIASGPETTVFLRRISSPVDLGLRLGWDARMIERWLFRSRSQVEFIEMMHNAMREHTGKPIWAEKTPANIHRFSYIRRHFPNAKLIHLIRDGRDVVSSLRRKPFAKIDGAAWDSVMAARRCGAIWRRDVLAGLRHRGGDRVYELRYEDLVRHPEATLRALLIFLEIPWSTALLEATNGGADNDERLAASSVNTASIGRWATELSPADIAALRAVIGPLLIDLEYASGMQW